MNTHFRIFKSHVSAWLFLCLACALLSLPACSPSAPSKSAYGVIPKMPIQLNHDTTVFYLSDLPGIQIDSVKWEDGNLLRVDTLEGEAVVFLTEQPKRQLGFLQCWSGMDHWEIPVFHTTRVPATIHVASFAPLERVDVIGSFTNWQSNPIAMEGSNGWFKLELMLEAGTHPYQLVIDGVEKPDPGNPRMVPNGFGGYNSILQVGEPHKNLPLDMTFVPGSTSAEIQVADGFIGKTEPGAYFYAWWNDRIYGFGKSDSTGLFRVGIPAAAYGAERSHIRFWTANADYRSQEVLLPLQNGLPIRNAAELTRFDRQSMIMYFLMVDRFKNGDTGNDWKSDDPGVLPKANHFGGDLTGIASSLDYIDSLGANTIWVSPITPNPDGAWGFWSDPNTDVTSKFSGYHGYWPIASTGIDRRFGTMDEFNALVKEIHARNQNILVDYVANHVHQEHPIYQAHPDWVTDLYLPDGSMNTQLWDEQRLTTWFDTFMPTLELRTPEVYQTMTDSAVWWIENTDIDGFRHDATKHIPEVFWRTLTQKVRAAERSPVFQIGETYGPPPLIRSYLSNGMLDAQFDFNLYDALVAAFTADTADVAALIDVANQSLATYGAHHLMGNITGNQDRPRFTSLADGALNPGEDTKFAGWTRDIQHNGNVGYRKMSWLMTFLMSSPGIPCIYYGDEIADAGGNDPDNRRMMRFENWNPEEKWIWNWTQKWTQLRKTRMSMLYGTSEYLELAPGLLAIHRKYLDEHTWVLINTTAQPFELSMDNQVPLTPLLGTLLKAEDGKASLQPWGCAAFDVRPYTSVQR